MQISQYIMYETEIQSNQMTGFILTADNKKDVIYQLEAESFTVKYYLLQGPHGRIEIRSKEQLLQWYDCVA